MSPKPARSQQPQEGELLPLPEAQPKTAIVEYTQTEKALAELRGRLKNVVFDVKTTAGDKAARTARKELVTLRTSLDEKRLELNAKDLERVRGRNAEAKRITEEIEALEEPLDKQIKGEEQRKADEKKAREEAERARVAAIQARIEEIRQYPLDVMGASAEHIESIIKKVVDTPVDDGFQELKQQAEGAKATTLIRLRAAHTKARAFEDEQARLTQERAENERIRLENEAHAAAERTRIAEEERVAREGREAEMARQRAATELHTSRMSEIHGIQQQVIIAQCGRLGVRKGGTIECIRETLAETEKWPITESNFGPLTAIAQSAKDNALIAIEELLLAAEAKAVEAAEATRQAEALRLQREESDRIERERQEERAKAEREIAERLAAAEAHEQRLTEASAALERDQEALRVAQERAAAPPAIEPPPVEAPPEAPEPALEKPFRPTDEAIIHMLATTYCVSKSIVITWLASMDLRKQLEQIGET